jgi:adenosine deaminase
MSLDTYLQAIPKVELHVHLEGSIQPETLLQLASRYQIDLPARDVPGLRDWYTFTDFDHFISVYIAISNCLRTYEDIELIAREFFINQARQNVRYCEVTYTPFSHYRQKKLEFKDQLAALNRARRWAEDELGVRAGWVIDISRNTTPEEGLLVADWAISAMGDGVVALGLGGPEVGHPPEKFADAGARALAAGLPCVPHAGETMGPESIWGALRALYAVRIGHGVRCLEDPDLVTYLRDNQIPLEVCPTSNICLKVFPNLESHPLPRLMAEGLYVTLNSDDPPLFNTSLVEEYQCAARVLGLDVSDLEELDLNALRASLLPAAEKNRLETEFSAAFTRLRLEHL